MPGGGGGTLDWHLIGNNTTSITPLPFIGTLNVDDFRIRTNDNQIARFTSSVGTGTPAPKYGNFELGSGSTFIGSTDKSVAFGENNKLDNSKNGLASGSGNELNNSSDNSGAVGVSNKFYDSKAAFASGSSNIIKSKSDNSTATGEGNIIDNAKNALAGGKQNKITDADNCIISGFSNEISVSNGVFSSGTDNGIYLNSHNSGAFGELNSITSSARTIVTGYQNVIASGSDNSGALGNNDSIIGSQNAFALGFNNKIKNSSSTIPTPTLKGSDNSAAIGQNNSIERSLGSFAAGSGNKIIDASGNGCMALGTGNTIVNSEVSTALGESNVILDAHGTFIAGGHNVSNVGGYNALIGQWLTTDATPPSASGFIYNSRIIIGERINNANLDFSHTVGFNQNRTTVTTQRGMAVQLNPSTVTYPINTYAPTVNFEVDGGISGAPALLMPGSARSNIRFHNLPDTRDRLPVIMVDRSTGELFLSQRDYDNPPPIVIGNDSNQNMMIADLKKSIEEQKIQIANQQKQLVDLLAAVKILTDSKGENNKKDAEQNIVLSNKEPMLLYQNVPNPFQGQTSIAYYIPASVNTAYIRFTNVDGKIIKTIPLTEKGKGLISIDAADLSQGIYNYSLYVDGALIDTKKMMLK